MQMGSRKSAQTKNNFIESIRIESKLSSNRIESFSSLPNCPALLNRGQLFGAHALGDVLRPSLREGATPAIPHPHPQQSSAVRRAQQPSGGTQTIVDRAPLEVMMVHLCGVSRCAQAGTKSWRHHCSLEYS